MNQNILIEFCVIEMKKGYKFRVTIAVTLLLGGRYLARRSQ